MPEHPRRRLRPHATGEQRRRVPVARVERSHPTQAALVDEGGERARRLVGPHRGAVLLGGPSR
ncbi:hypothetical protein ABTY20_21490 [Streptomyces sp. NPDC126497]|uniref:hypothetical protein n=1 Tax=Streptomyces sp. NPDC126497 TaxID=3155313 RepID=UPI00332378E8